jgi:hypothetical protein
MTDAERLVARIVELEYCIRYGLQLRSESAPSNMPEWFAWDMMAQRLVNGGNK